LRRTQPVGATHRHRSVSRRAAILTLWHANSPRLVVLSTFESSYVVHIHY
jgi:hypothetical protein